MPFCLQTLKKPIIEIGIKGFMLIYIELRYDAFVKGTFLKPPFCVCSSFCMKLKEMGVNPYF